MASDGACQDFRRLKSKHLELVTDLAPSDEIERLPAWFDEGMRQAAAYFHIDPKRLDDWKLTGYLMGHPDRFRAAGYLHERLPRFENGYQLGDEFWFYEQPSDYYRRHLMLHEGVHALMFRFLGGAGPPWYREGMAELLSTHTLNDAGSLRINQMPQEKQQFPEWGRITKIQETVRDESPPTIRQIMSVPYREFNSVENYAWGWATCRFLDQHPAFRDAFRRSHARLKLPTQAFNAQLLRDLASASEDLDLAWQLMVHEIEYGYDVAENQLQAIPGEAQLGKPFKIRTDQGWQATGIVVEPETHYQLQSAGRFLLDAHDRRWVSDPNGVTLEYRQGRPRGELLLAVVSSPPHNDPSEGKGSERQRPESRPSRATPRMTLTHPMPVGRGAKWTSPRTGTLMLRVNEPAGERADNQGEVRILVTQAES